MWLTILFLPSHNLHLLIYGVLSIIIIIIIIIIITFCDFFIPALADFFFFFFLLKSKWLHVSSGLQDSPKYSGRS